MKRNPKKKAKKKTRRKKGTGKFLVFLIIVGLGVFLAYHFRQEILDFLKPPPGKKIEKKPEHKVAAKEKKIVTLFFSEEEGEYLVEEKREILKTGGIEEEAKETVIELIKGPKGKLIPVLPSHTRLLTLQIEKDGVAKVNFDKTLSKEHPGGSSAEMLTLYSIVNSLTLNFPQIKRVQILIDGKEAESIAGHISLKQPVSSNLSIVKKMEKNRGLH
jgi:spore germination protein GerM